MIRGNGKRIWLAALLASVSLDASAVQFGHDGANGYRGENGRSGASGQDVTITASSSLKSYVTVGAPGEDGSPGGIGYDATRCSPPYRPRYNISGADGGDGGYGGSGGNGGSGGHALIYTSSKAKLKNVKLINSGARGGQGAEGGAYGGDGCFCRERSWSFFECSWRLYRRPDPDQNGQGWSYVRTERNDCTDRRYPPRDPYGNGYIYRWDYAGQSTDTYYCSNGRSGVAGRRGSNGNHGSYGSVAVVVGSSLPKVADTYRGVLSRSLSKFYPVSTNLFVRKTGLQNLLHRDSDVFGVYNEFVRKEERKVGFQWRLPNGPAYYGFQNSNISARLYQPDASRPEAAFSVSLPGGLKYEVKQIDANHWNIVINGFEGRLPPPPPPGGDKCSEHSGKGSLICEFSGFCVYENGICKARR